MTRPLRILCVEDQEILGDVMLCLLSQAGHWVEHVNDGIDAWDRISQDVANFDVVITGQVRRMANGDLFLHYLEFLNPSLREQKISDPLEFFDPEKSIQENCWHGECRPLERPDTGFYHDGYYHGMLVLKALPKRTRPGIAYLLTKLGFRDYAITVNIEPVDVEQLIDKEQKELTRVEGDYLRRYSRRSLSPGRGSVPGFRRRSHCSRHRRLQVGARDHEQGR